ncbi:MAG: serine/threonine-protein kinase [Candidatus Xenobia bacterium]
MLDWFKRAKGQTSQNVNAPAQTSPAEVAPLPPQPPRGAAPSEVPDLRPPQTFSHPSFGKASGPRLPERIGRYRIRSILGQGGMARVYLAEFDDENPEPQRYAVKTLITMEDGDSEAYERFKREIQICMKLRHPNVCLMVDWGIEQDKTPYIVMELLEGEVLVDFIARMAPVSVSVAKPIIVQILQGIGAIHAAGVIHRDLKPGNVFLTQEGSVKIMDFGIARKAGLKSLTATGSALGTPEFISPEQVLDTRNVDHRTDLFNVGLIFYELLSGQLPFEAPTVSDMLLRLVRGTLTPISSFRNDLPPGLEEWLSRLLSQDRDKRFQTAKAALDAITW